MNPTSKFFFTADEHYGHANIIKYCNRPFTSVDEVDAEIIQRHNELAEHAGIARQKALFVAGKVHFIFKTLRKGATALKKLTDDRIKVLIDQYIKEAIKSWCRIIL
jgi:calcineurin-like phosphoesterase family protein